MKKFPSVHRDDKVRRTGIRQDIPCVFSRNSKRHELAVGFVGGLDRRPESGARLWDGFHGPGNDIFRFLGPDVPLALLAKTCNSMPDELMGAGTADAVHRKDE